MQSKVLTDHRPQWAAKSGKYLEVVHKLRVGDFARYKVPFIRTQTAWTSTPLTNTAYQVIENEQYLDTNKNPMLGPRGDATYEDIKYQDSFEKARAAGHPLSHDQREALLDLNTSYGAPPPPGVTPDDVQIHRNVITSVNEAKKKHVKPLGSTDSDCT